MCQWQAMRQAKSSKSIINWIYHHHYHWKSSLIWLKLIYIIHLINIIFVYIICSRDYRSYLNFKLIINLLFESKQASFSSQYEIHLHHHHHRNEKCEEIFEKNLTESKVVAARRFNVNAKSLNAFIQRDSDAKNEKHNKMLQNQEIDALDDFIRSLLKHEILSTSE